MQELIATIETLSALLARRKGEGEAMMSQLEKSRGEIADLTKRLTDSWPMVLACYRSGQVSEAQWQQHLADPVFAAWVKENDEAGE